VLLGWLMLLWLLGWLCDCMSESALLFLWEYVLAIGLGCIGMVFLCMGTVANPNDRPNIAILITSLFVFLML